MGNKNSRQELVVDMRDCNVGKLSNYSDAKEIESLRNSFPNHFTGYEQRMGVKISDYIKYDNGLYLYMSRAFSIRFLFDMEKFSMMKNFKVHNEDVKMYIQIEERFSDGNKKVNMYESDNFVALDSRNCFLIFAFISKVKIEDEFNISVTKLLAGPKSFEDKLTRRNGHITVKDGFTPEARKITFFEIIGKEGRKTTV